MSDKFNLEGFKVDENNVCTADGGFAGDITGGVILSNQTAYIASGVIDTSKNCHFLDSSSGARNMTLDSNYALANIGKIMTFSAAGYSSAMTITTVFGDGSTVATFSAAGEGLTVIAGQKAGSGKWFIVGNNGLVIS